MKTMNCKQLGGACNQKFHSETFEEMAEQSRKHAIEMFQSGDKAHIQAMRKMQKLMQSSDAMAQWMESKRKEFDTLPEY
jgi:hypothetical protein